MLHKKGKAPDWEYESFLAKKKNREYKSLKILVNKFCGPKIFNFVLSYFFIYFHAKFYSYALKNGRLVGLLNQATLIYYAHMNKACKKVVIQLLSHASLQTMSYILYSHNNQLRGLSGKELYYYYGLSHAMRQLLRISFSKQSYL